MAVLIEATSVVVRADALLQPLLCTAIEEIA